MFFSDFTHLEKISGGVQRPTLLKTVLFFGLSATVSVVLLLAVTLWHFSYDLPQIITLADYKPLGVTRILARVADEVPTGPGTQHPAIGTVEIGEFFKERRYVVPYDQMPTLLIQAFISAEDDRFFEHNGINFLSILRAGIANFKAGRVVQGGSTITQQLAKSLLLTPERSLSRKVKEVILVGRIEKHLTKQEILYLYLNQIYLGHGAYGVQAASRVYFRKDVSQLSLAEAALLAGMPQAPGKYSPLLNPKKAKDRQSYVLKRMLENKYITPTEFVSALKEQLKIYHSEDVNDKYAPYYVEYIRKFLLETYGEKKVYEDGLTIYVPTTLPLLQSATKSVREGLLTIDKRLGYRGPLQHLNTAAEIKAFLEEYQLKVLKKKVEFQLLLPEGKIDSTEAMRAAGFKEEVELLDPGTLYQAVVVGLNDGKKTARLMIGAIAGELSLEHMSWARATRDEKVSQTVRPFPTLPSKVFQKGDVILVSLVNSHPLPFVASDSVVPVALEQEPLVQGALLSLEVNTGHVLAMVGGYDFKQSEFNRATQALRQAGSAFKPIIYSAALEKGYTPTTVIVDAPIVFKDAEGLGKWKPNNYEEKFYGDTSFRQAFIKSRNIPTVKIVQNIQVPYLIQYARRLGITSSLPSDLSISLGSSSNSLMDLTKIYSLFPRFGRKVEPVFISSILNREGSVLQETKSPPVFPGPPVSGAIHVISTSSYPPPDDPNQVLDPRIAFVMTHLMKEVVVFGTGHQAKNLGRLVAGKTGTTNDNVDAWFLGFTPDIVTGVWVGFDNQRSIGPGETGARAALPIWLNYMKEAVKTYPDTDFIPPAGVVFAQIDPNTGKVASPHAPGTIREAFLEGTEPVESTLRENPVSDSQSEFYQEDQD